MSNSKSFDVAIVGGGLAGLSLAILCASNNYNVILFEKEEYPFHKVCGEYISMESYGFLERLGLPLKDLKVPFINCLKTSDIKGSGFSFQLPLGGFGISRYLLDNCLYKIANDRGAVIKTSTKVIDVTYEENMFTIITEDIKYEAKTAAGCFGKRSNLDIKWKREFTLTKPESKSNYVGVKYHIEYDHPENEIALHNFHNGYCGMSKIEEGKSCLCYLTTAENLRKADYSVQKMEHTILFKNPFLHRIFTSAKFTCSKPVVISQISFSKKQQVEDHILMMGDSAGLISPLCGNGMSMAMNAAQIGYVILDKYLRNKITQQQMEQQYTDEWKNTFQKRLWVGRQVQRFFGGTKSSTLFLKLMKQFPTMAKRLIRATHGKSF